MSLNYNTELALINTTTNSGTITLPSATTVPGRVISFKDSAGNFLTNNFTLICDGSDTFEDGTTQKVFNESFGSIQVVASGTKWYILSGVKQNSMTVSSLLVSSISTYSISFSDGSFQTISADKNINSSIIGLGTLGYISTSQLFSTTTGLVDHLELNSSIRGLGTLSYLSSFNSISSLNISTGSLLVNNYTGDSISSLRISSGSLFSGVISSIQFNASSINANRIFTSNITGPGSAVVTTNLYPQTGGAQLGYGSNTAQGGFYGFGMFRSTITQVIQGSLDNNSFSNVVRIQGNLSSQNIFSSTINSGTVTLTTGGFIQRVVSSAVAPSGTVTLNLTSGNVFYFSTATPTATTVNFTTLSATVGSTYYVNFLSGTPTAAAVTFTGNTGATTLSITGLSLVGNPSVSIGLHGAAQSFTPAVNTRYMFTCIAIAP